MKPTMAIAGVVIIVVILVIVALAVMKPSSTNSSSSAPSAGSTAASSVATSVSATTAAGTHTNTTNSTHANSTTKPGYNFEQASNSSVGNYLANSAGYTLYLYTSDTPHSNASTCYGSCSTYWAPFIVNATFAVGTVPSGVNASSFGMITRTGGAKQLTYEGWPLYYYLADKAPGEVNGEGVGGTWYVITLPKLTIPNHTA
ncbi:MAG: hypothetical protein KGH64_02760 [Candidatus Micrarchaeota archaeon]|nr:hypothetical protein [Candidatus Micrarchaeota archaeon]MDE1834234.1 hypothetical protein [Candidatus Micrarchaeota archaeon]MDE1859295.1 hypothetical protein [Candidatus Micrarchaeota archaeon]